MRYLLQTCVFLVYALPTAAQDAHEIAFVKSILNPAQSISIKEKREVCGYIGITSSGKFKATRAKRGDKDSCYVNTLPRNLDIIASYHTHAAFDPNADSEVPSFDDLLADMDEGIDGYVATPGGRLWFIDGRRGETRQICGLKCLISDKSFRPALFGAVKLHYNLSQLKKREAGY